MKIRSIGLAFAATLAIAATGAQAAVIDFSTTQGFNGNPLVLPEATINNLSGGTVLVGPTSAGEVDGFCFLGGGSCEQDGELIFAGAVTGVVLDIDGFQGGDSVLITAFNGAAPVGSLPVTGNGTLDFSGFGTITRLFFDDSSNAAGVGYSTITFNPGASVPEPTALALVGLALLAGAFGRRGRR